MVRLSTPFRPAFEDFYQTGRTCHTDIMLHPNKFLSVYNVYGYICNREEVVIEEVRGNNAALFAAFEDERRL